MKIIKRALLVLLAAALLLAALILIPMLLGDSPQPYDGPPPSKNPPPLSGVYAGEYGALTYNGDGATVEARFQGRAAEFFPDGTYQYAYCWYHYGPCQYDVATVCRLWDKEAELEWSFDCLGTGEEMVLLSYVTNTDSPDYPNTIDRLDMVFQRTESPGP